MEPRFIARPATPALADAIEVVWAVRLPGRDHCERVLPTPRAQLLIRLTEDRLDWADGAHHRLGGAALSGPYGTPFTIDARQQDGALGVVFRPGGLAAFVGLPVRALAGTHVELADVWPDAEPFVARARAGSLEQGLVALEALLLAHRKRAIHPGVQRAMRELTTRRSRVGAVADALGWSVRTLRRRFDEHLGLGPKDFARVNRFREAVDTLTPTTDLGEHALRWGFADQAHFNHDFRALSGMTPSEWRAGERPWSTHVVV